MKPTPYLLTAFPGRAQVCLLAALLTRLLVLLPAQQAPAPAPTLAEVVKLSPFMVEETDDKSYRSTTTANSIIASTVTVHCA
jgi:hypothetical protein